MRRYQKKKWLWHTFEVDNLESEKVKFLKVFLKKETKAGGENPFVPFLLYPSVVSELEPFPVGAGYLLRFALEMSRMYHFLMNELLCHFVEWVEKSLFRNKLESPHLVKMSFLLQIIKWHCLCPGSLLWMVLAVACDLMHLDSVTFQVLCRISLSCANWNHCLEQDS